MIQFKSAILALVLVFSGVYSANAHHSDVGIDLETLVTIEGVVTEFNWRNPHVYLLVDVPNEEGGNTEWEIQMGAVSVSRRRGWSADYLAPGDQVSIELHARANGDPYGILEELERHDGEALGITLSTPDGSAVAESIEGRWIADASSFPDYPGGYDGLFLALLSLNDRARQAIEEYDPLSADNPNSTCVGRPTPGALVSTRLYMMEFEIDEGNDLIYIRSERDAEERVVYMDGREHPSPDQLVNTGHSIGWWEDDTLVVETTNFPFHRSPYQLGVPSSTEKRVVERYRLNETGTRLHAEFTLWDPVYLTGPMTHARDLIFDTQTEMILSGCDPDAAGRFLIQ